MKLHNLVNKLQQKILEGLGDLDVVVASNSNEIFYDLTSKIEVTVDEIENKKVILLLYEEW